MIHFLLVEPQDSKENQFKKWSIINNKLIDEKLSVLSLLSQTALKWR